MWYEAVSVSGVSTIGLAVSSNGKDWKKFSDKPVFTPSSTPGAWDSGGVGAPHLVWLNDKSRWRMYYVGCTAGGSINTGDEGVTAIGVAESNDEMGTEFIRIIQ